MSLIGKLRKRGPKLQRVSQSERDRIRALRLSLPDPLNLDDEGLSERLWRALTQLAHMQVVLLHTDHLSDRELYILLVHEVLQEKTWPTKRSDSIHLINMMVGRSEGSLEDYLRFYADDATRRYCAKHCSDVAIPERESPPFDRDRLLASLQW